MEYEKSFTVSKIFPFLRRCVVIYSNVYAVQDLGLVLQPQQAELTNLYCF